MARIFLSHSSSDEREAVALNCWLTANGWDDIFLDVDPERGLGGHRLHLPVPRPPGPAR